MIILTAEPVHENTQFMKINETEICGGYHRSDYVHVTAV